MTSPSAPARPWRRPRASSLRVKPSRSITAVTRCAVSCATPGSSLTTRETVFRLRRAERPGLWRVVRAARRVGGQEEQRGQGAGGSDPRGNVVRGAEAVEERGAGGVVQRRRQGRVAGAAELVGGGERRADGPVRRLVGAGRQALGQRAGEAAGV